MDWTLTTVLLYYNHIIINHQSTIVLTGYNRLSYMYIDHQDVYIYIYITGYMYIQYGK